MAGRGVGLLVRLGLDDSEFGRRMQASGKKLDAFAGRTRRMAARMQRVGDQLTRKLTLPIVAIGAGALKSFADFDKAMTESLAIMSDVSPKMRKEMEATAKTIAGKTVFSAAQAAEGFYFLASAGYDANASIRALPQVAKFAQAGNFDLAVATEYAADAQAALGLKSKNAQQNLRSLTRVTDVLTHGANISNASVEQFAQALTNKAAAGMRNMGKEIEEGVAVLAAFADQGLKGAAAGEAYNIVMRDLGRAARKNKDEFRDAGIAVFDASGEMRNAADIVEDLEKALKGMSDKQKQATLSMLGFQDKSVANLITLLGTSKAIRKYQAQLEEAGGVTQRVADKQMESFHNRLLRLRNQLTNAGIEIGAKLAPAFERLAEFAIKVATGFANMSPATQDMILKFGLLAAGLGPVIKLAANLLSILSAIARHPIAAAVIAIGAAAAGVIHALSGMNTELAASERWARGANAALQGLKHTQDALKGVAQRKDEADLQVTEARIYMRQSQQYLAQLKREGATKLEIKAATTAAQRAELNWMEARRRRGAILNEQRGLEGTAAMEAAAAASSAEAAKVSAGREAAAKLTAEWERFSMFWGRNSASWAKLFRGNVIDMVARGEIKAGDLKAALDNLPENVRTEVEVAVRWQMVGAQMEAGLNNLISGILAQIPGKAHGGSVRRGRPYIVGEQRPELFVPSGSGRILPSVPTMNGGGVTVVVKVDNRGGQMGDAAVAQLSEKLAERIERRLRSAQSRQVANLLGA